MDWRLQFLSLITFSYTLSLRAVWGWGRESRYDPDERGKVCVLQSLFFFFKKLDHNSWLSHNVHRKGEKDVSLACQSASHWPAAGGGEWICVTLDDENSEIQIACVSVCLVCESACSMCPLRIWFFVLVPDEKRAWNLEGQITAFCCRFAEEYYHKIKWGTASWTQ